MVLEGSGWFLDVGVDGEEFRRFLMVLDGSAWVQGTLVILQLSVDLGISASAGTLMVLDLGHLSLSSWASFSQVCCRLQCFSRWALDATAFIDKNDEPS